jgi:AcrR family transcriptional regulator
VSVPLRPLDLTIRTLDEERVLMTAEELVVRLGWDRLTMTALAEELGVRPQSLYRHVDGIDGVRRALFLRGVTDLGEVLRTAVMGRSGADAVRAVAVEYRAYAHQHPARYVAQTKLMPDDAVRAAAARSSEAVDAALRSYGLRDDELGVAAAQLWALVHGFTSLELVGAMAWLDDRESAFIGLIDMFEAGLRNR